MGDALIAGVTTRRARAGYPRAVLSSPNWRASGISLIECLITNGLAVALISSLWGASADLIATVRDAALRSDQDMRARQVFQFVTRQLARAVPPPEWALDRQDGVGPGWSAPGAPCASPEGMSEYLGWGGVAVVALATLDCLPGNAEGTGIYIEQILPCPDFCGEGPGLMVYRDNCGNPSGADEPTRAWQVLWRSTMTRPTGACESAYWGRLERLLLSHRLARDSAESAPTLRLYLLSPESGYEWQPSETLVAGVDSWRPRLVAVSVFNPDAGPADGDRSEALSLSVSIGSGDPSAQVPELVAARLLTLQRPAPRG